MRIVLASYGAALSWSASVINISTPAIFSNTFYPLMNPITLRNKGTKLYVFLTHLVSIYCLGMIKSLAFREKDFKWKKSCIILLVSYQWKRKVESGCSVSHTHKHKDMPSPALCVPYLSACFPLLLCVSSSYPFLAVPPKSSHRQLEEQPAAPARRYSRLHHHAPCLTERACTTSRVCLLSRSRQTLSLCPPLRLHGSLLFQTDALVPLLYKLLCIIRLACFPLIFYSFTFPAACLPLWLTQPILWQLHCFLYEVCVSFFLSKCVRAGGREGVS